jgi:hypothetical protein
VQAGRQIAEIELGDAQDRMDRLTDSLAVRLLRELGRSRRLPAFREARLGSASFPALKAFLAGEQWFRRAAWDSAAAAYKQAIALDSTFPLPFRRLSRVQAFATNTILDSLSVAYALRAGALNHGLGPRDSLLLAAESLTAAVNETFPRGEWSTLRRLHAMALETTRRYPDDPESWVLLGEVYYHYGSALHTGRRGSLEAFDRAIALDSSFAPSYIHPIEDAFLLDGWEAGRRYTRAYLAQTPTDAYAPSIRLVDQLLDPSLVGSSETLHLLETASTETLLGAWLIMNAGADSAEAAVRVARRLATGLPTDRVRPSSHLSLLGESLLFRGHLREASQILSRDSADGDSVGNSVSRAELALLGAIPPDTAAALFRRWLEHGKLFHARLAAPWWAARRDTASLRQFEWRSDSAARGGASGDARRRGLIAREAARAYLALTRSDTTEALRRFAGLDSLCAGCYLEKLTRVRLLSARGEDRQAGALLESQLVAVLTPFEVVWALERGRVAERLGEREKAINAYRYVAGAWRHADPELHPSVAEAKAAIQRLSGEPRR